MQMTCPEDSDIPEIERMLRDDLVLPIDMDFGDTPNYIEGSLSPYITE